MHLNGLIQNRKGTEKDVYICTGLRKHWLKWEAFIVRGLFAQIDVKTVPKDDLKLGKKNEMFS